MNEQSDKRVAQDACPGGAGVAPVDQATGPTRAYDAQAIEAKWRQRWAETGLYRTPEPANKRTFYCLSFFPYPSGDGLSVGHGRNYVPGDVISRYRRMTGDAVLHPMGWDAFGLPAENEAIRKGVHPQVSTGRYAANYRRQMTLMGCSYDWEREIKSSDPAYYRWTQWFFLLLHRRGLAYRASGKQWWCPECRTVLANEQVDEHNVCWRGHGGVGRKTLVQWFLRITAYADALLAGLETLDWPEFVLAKQREWIGRSLGVEFQMSVAGCADSFLVYTTRPETVCGMTFAVLAPEHPLLPKITPPEYRAAVDTYCREAEVRSDLARASAGRDGVLTGAHAINPVTRMPVPIYTADYVLMGHGHGAIMGVPAHDERNFDFARKHHLPVTTVIIPPASNNVVADASPQLYVGAGVMVNSGIWDGLPSDDVRERIVEWMEAEGMGRRAVHYRMRDWLISRQRYWGTPIPIIHCDACGMVPVPEPELPVLLPEVGDWQPGADGRSPLARVARFVETACPDCGRPARRETDTLDGFACSSWYYLRFVSPGQRDQPFDPAALAAWGPPDLYLGGAEHAVMHLLYARFWAHVMHDAGAIPFREPFPVLRNQGMMHARDPRTGRVLRMSKSAGNVVTPDSVAAQQGADALRVYLLFMAPFEASTVWDEAGVAGARRFLERAWKLVQRVVQAAVQPSQPEPTPTIRRVHRAVRSVTQDLERLRFNTAIAELMTLLNAMADHVGSIGVTSDLMESCRLFVLLLAPFAPHVAEEMWGEMGLPYSVHQHPWPSWDPSLTDPVDVTYLLQVNGRVRGRLTVPAGAADWEVQDQALENPNVARHLIGQRVQRVVLVPGRVVNIVTGADSNNSAPVL
jgi:leucyl-tRNA synthetase